MKLPLPTLDLTTQLAEFDVWLTPSLGEIRDTRRFQQELANIASLVEALGQGNANFKDEADCGPEPLADKLIELVQNVGQAEAKHVLESLASLLFFVSGKSDNNAKCQLPLYLRDHGWKTMPILKRIRRKDVMYMYSVQNWLKWGFLPTDGPKSL